MITTRTSVCSSPVLPSSSRFTWFKEPRHTNVSIHGLCVIEYYWDVMYCVIIIIIIINNNDDYDDDKKYHHYDDDVDVSTPLISYLVNLFKGFHYFSVSILYLSYYIFFFSIYYTSFMELVLSSVDKLCLYVLVKTLPHPCKNKHFSSQPLP